MVPISEDGPSGPQVETGAVEIPDNYFSLTLTQSAFLPGNLRSVEGVADAPTANPKPPTIKTVTGITESRLDEVRSYNLLTPFIVGVNGVTSVDGNAIVYVVDGVTYATSTDENGVETTAYNLGIVPPTQAANTLFLYRNERDVFIDRKDTVRDILIERSNLSVFDPMLRMALVNSLDDLTDYFRS